MYTYTILYKMKRKKYTSGTFPGRLLYYYHYIFCKIGKKILYLFVVMLDLLHNPGRSNRQYTRAIYQATQNRSNLTTSFNKTFTQAHQNQSGPIFLVSFPIL